MADSFKVELVASTKEIPAAAELPPGTPFRILVIGDFGGRSSRGPVAGGPGLAGRRPVRVDRDDLDRVLAGLKVELRLPVEVEDAAPIVLRFGELDDFRPDPIYERVEAFRALRELRRKLSDPSTFVATLRELGPGPGAGPRESGGGAGVVEAPPPEDLLERILEESRGGSAPARSPEAGPWAGFLARITAPYRAAAADPRQAEMVAGVDEATGQFLREILHHPDVQALEAAWRSVGFLVRRLETDEQLTVSLLDATRAELEADLLDGNDPQATGLRKILVEAEGPWAVVVGDMTFDATGEDIALLGRLAAVAQRAGAPFLAAASPRFLGCTSLMATPDPDGGAMRMDDPDVRATWDDLRGRPEAAYLGLALPRVLLRLPYGGQDDPMEAFDFEELDPDAGERSFLWGNPAYVLAALLGQAFSRSGWQLRPGEVRELDGLPLYVAGAGEDASVLPCAGVSLSDRAAEVILDQGLMPMLSPRDRDVVRVGRFQSVAEPSRGLAGRWSG